jgi:hypothetical protein
MPQPNEKPFARKTRNSSVADLRDPVQITFRN